MSCQLSHQIAFVKKFLQFRPTVAVETVSKVSIPTGAREASYGVATVSKLTATSVLRCTLVCVCNRTI